MSNHLKNFIIDVFMFFICIFGINELFLFCRILLTSWKEIATTLAPKSIWLSLRTIYLDLIICGLGPRVLVIYLLVSFVIYFILLWWIFVSQSSFILGILFPIALLLNVLASSFSDKFIKDILANNAYDMLQMYLVRFCLLFSPG